MTAESGGGSITSFLTETRVFPPPAGFAEQAHIRSLDEYQALWDRARDDPEGFWAEMAGVLSWASRGTEVLDWTPPHAAWFVGGRLNAATTASTATAKARTANKAALIFEGEPGDRRVLTYGDLQREVGTFANGLEGARGPAGRRRGDLHADDPRGGHRHARLRPDRRGPHGRLRRLQRRGPGRPDPGLLGEGPRHRRRRLSPGQGRPAQGQRRRRRGQLPDHRARRRRTSDRASRRDDRRARPAGGTTLAPAARRLPGRAVRQRAPALHPLYLGLDRQAQGDPPHHRRLHGRRDADLEVGLRSQARGHLLLHRRRRLGHRPYLPGLRPARQRGDGRPL